MQSVMDLHHPSRLVLPHLHALALGLYLRPQTQQVLECGLGGGAFGRFLLQHFQQAKWNSIEYDQTIIHCFTEYFNPSALPVIHRHADARDAIGEFQSQDLLLLDLFDQNQPPVFLADTAFYQSCFNVLNQHGLLMINLLPSRDVSLLGLSSALLQASGHPPKVIRVPGYRNMVLFSSREPLPSLKPGKNLLDFAERLGVDLSCLVLARD
ncbi:hypothetical protein P2G88_06155 [Aliiglaciecola sp. CAU 1673]|uniref:hypothetical protein n=1 Tax=Aliiglaciecola sp. CAU 1673 TaxID=3032595 RepID=UPI0023DBA2BD|nr:hypothetical protein [Aliiglaciecola sp. CAU 1673]MDF2177828.1 hypothetical protein [Aliiglaciecola sp. CAU 1673]